MKISNTQIQDLQKCEKKFYFSQILRLRPKNYPDSMGRGIFGHDLMEVFFLAMKDGKTYEECVEASTALILENPTELSNTSVYRHVLAFGAYAFQMEWKVISVEENLLYQVSDFSDPDLLEYAFTPDIVFQWTRGPRNGTYFMLDFKFTGQTWNDREIAMYQQLFKYMIHWNLMNPEQKVQQLGVVCLLTRAAADAKGDKLFTTKWLKITREKLAEIERENYILMKRVAHAKATYEPEDYMRSSDSFTCKMCYFADDICPADLEGRSIENYLKINYEVNTYFDDNYGPEVVVGEEVVNE